MGLRWYLGSGHCLAGAFPCRTPPPCLPRGWSPPGTAAQSPAAFQGAAAKARAKLPLADQEQAAGQRVVLSAGSHENLHLNFPFFVFFIFLFFPGIQPVSSYTTFFFTCFKFFKACTKERNFQQVLGTI